MAQQCCLYGCSHQRFQIPASDFRIGIFAADHFTLLGNAYLPVHAMRRLSQYRLIAGAATPPDGAAASVEQAQLNLVPGKYLGKFGFSFIQFPIGGKKTAVLVAVGIAEHHLLHIATRIQEFPVIGQREQLVHNLPAAPQIRNGLEQWNDVYV